MSTTHEKILDHVLNTPEIASAFSWMNACNTLYYECKSLKEHPELLYIPFFADPFVEKSLKESEDKNPKPVRKTVYILLSTRGDVKDLYFSMYTGIFENDSYSDSIKYSILPNDKFKTYKGAVPYLLTFDFDFSPRIDNTGMNAKKIGLLYYDSFGIELKNKNLTYSSLCQNTYRSVYWNMWEKGLPKFHELKPIKWDKQWGGFSLNICPFSYSSAKGSRSHAWLRDKDGKAVRDKDYKAPPSYLLCTQKHFPLTGDIVIDRANVRYVDRPFDQWPRKFFGGYGIQITGDPVFSTLGSAFSQVQALYEDKLTDLVLDVYKDWSDFPEDSGVETLKSLRRFDMYKMPTDKDLINQ